MQSSNGQSSNDHYSMHQKVPMVFLLLLVCLSTVYYDYVKTVWAHVGAKIF